MKLLSADAGWVLTESQLRWTTSGGKGWEDITPPDVKAATILRVFFLDQSRGWVVSSKAQLGNDSGTLLEIAYTTDSGKTWSTNLIDPLGDDRDAILASAASLHFIDATRGWLMARRASSSNFSRGVLLTTPDGGNTWRRLPDPPIGDPVRFVSATDGWLAGGAAGDELYVTRDGGTSWSRKSVPPPMPANDSRPTYYLPVFKDSQTGILPVLFTSARESTITFYVTHDGGETWLPSKLSAPVGRAGDETQAAFGVVDSETVVLSSVGERAISSLGSDGKAVKRLLPQSDLGEAAVTKLDFATKRAGWLLTTSGTCEGFKTNCRQETKLFATADGGHTLEEITPRSKSEPPSRGGDKSLAEGSMGDEGPVLPSAVTTIQNKQGYDKCEIMTVNQMQTWWDSSPYRAVAFYIGGVHRACGNTGLTSSWVNSVSGMGWGLVPIWVGPQAPNSIYSNRISSNATTAEAEGVAEADKASDRAAAIGLNPQTIIYYDIEAFNRTDTTSRNAVKAFINGWVRRMHQRGNVAGVYSSHPHFQDWTPSNIANPPDAIWFAWFFQNGVSCGTACHTVFGVPTISDSLWNNHQRIRQTSSTIDRCWGGVCFTGNGGIDEDYLDGPVAGSGGSGCSFTAGQGASGSELTAFQNAHSSAGGQSVLGCPTAAVRTDGFTSFSGTTGHFQAFANGEIEYLTNSNRAGQAYAVVNPLRTKWASFGFTNNNPLGYPISNLSAQGTSCQGTNHKYQSFEGGSLTHHLSGARNGSVFEVHGSIHRKWELKGFAVCPLGLPISDESTAQPSGATGKTGKLSAFEGGHIYWITNAAESFEVHGAIYSLYVQLGGSAGWLGFPTSDEFVSNGFARSNFEGGFITTSDGVNYRAFRNDCPSVSQISPTTGGTGSSVVITGSNFNGVSAVKFVNNVVASFSVDSNSRITVTVPNGAVTGPITISKSGCGDVLTGTFTVSIQTPPPPSLNPAANITSTDASLSWLSVNGATQYRVQISTSSVFNTSADSRDCFNCIPNGNQLIDAPTTNHNLSGLNAGTTYHWRVRAGRFVTTSEWTTEWSAVNNFRTQSSPGDRPKTAGVFRPSNGIVYLKNQNTGGFADLNLVYGVAGDLPVAGDWNGDGVDSLGIYRGGVFYLRNSNTTGPADLVFPFGAAGDLPVAGDWNGDGITTIGVYRSATGVFFLRNSNTAGPPDVSFVLGNPGDVPIAGDWNGDGITTTGVFRPTNGIIYLKNSNVSGDADINLVYGNAGDLPVAGDWNGDGVDSVGIYRGGLFYLRNSNTQGFADLVFALGNPGDVPIAGDWDGLP